MKKVSMLLLSGLALGACESDIERSRGGGTDQVSGDVTTSTSRCLCGLAALVAINTGDQDLYRWTRPTANAGDFSSSTKVGISWASMRLLASDAATGDLFAVHTNGNLYRYTWGGASYTGGAVVGTGWGSITQLIPSGYGVLYAVHSNGNLYWYRWLGSAWAARSGSAIGTGWGAFSKVFGGGDGVLYGISNSTGELFWYRHNAPMNGYISWRGPRKVGTGWGAMRDVVGLGGGMMYAIDPQGKLLSYQHLDLVEGGAYWANNGIGQQIGSGWLSYQHLTASPNACPTFPQQCMSQGDGLTCGTGGDPKTLYRTYQGVTSPIRYCANGCRSMPLRAGVWQDQCSAAPGKKSVAIQAGHDNIDANCRSALVGDHGATNEATWTAEISGMVTTKLVAAGHDARQVDANFNCDPLVLQHFDAVVSIHYQPHSLLGIGGGFFVGQVLSQFDAVASASAALQASVEFYYDQTGIPANLVANYTNINQYYLKNSDLLNHPELAGFVLSQDTPFVLIEAGEGAPDGAQHDVLWNQKDLVASGIAEGIIQYLQRQ